MIQILCVLFGLASWSATATFVGIPLCNCLFPRCRRPRNVRWLGDVTWAQVLGIVFSLLIIVVWFIWRNYGWMVPLQDILGFLVCAAFLTQLQIPSLKVGTVVLTLFAVYDVFMVFITPLIFNRSVMIDVATSGQPEPILDKDCYCRMHPDDSYVLSLVSPNINRWHTLYCWFPSFPGNSVLNKFCRFFCASRGSMISEVATACSAWETSSFLACC